MKKARVFLLSLIILSLSAVGAFAQEVGIERNNLNSIEIEQIIKKFTKNEDDFRFALTNYVFDRSATIQTIGLGGLVTGTYRRDSFMTFKKSGERFERITFFPMPTIREISITPEDLEDLGGVKPFAINPRDISLYTLTYVGKQKIDEIGTHVFDVRPKVIPKKIKKNGKRFFIGRIWVDDRDLMIVKSKGKGIPEGKQRFPVVETWRTNVDGKYWFPAYSSTDDELVFDNGQVVKMKMRVRYENYKQGRSEVIILDDDNPEEVIDNKPKDKDKTPPKKDNL
jgi:outer membrane lipoprotein-sorting protein